MRWTPGGTSDDIQDRRGQGGIRLGGIGGRGLGIGGTLLLLVLSVIFKQDLFTGLSVPREESYGDRSNSTARTAQEDTQVQFVSFVLDDAQKTWDRLLPETGMPYRHAKLVLFRDVTDSNCGTAQSATGPFYCPDDEKVYLDLGFFEELGQRFGAPGEFAQAYVIAHELGHHVQKVLGIERGVRRQQMANPAERNALSVRLELQADCLSGVWGHSTAQRKIIDAADVESGLRAAAAVGDDRLQRASTGRVHPESFTHGSSAERTQWFRRGLESGQLRSCNTFE